MHAYVLFALVTTAIGGAAWVFVYPILSGERAAERRKASIARPEPVAVRSTRAAQKTRREQVEGTLKEMEVRQRKAKRVPLAVRISQAGLAWSKRRFIVTAAALAAVRLNPQCRPWLLFSHASAEKGHRLLLEALEAKPLLDLGLRLGEGSGAAVALAVLRLACALHNGMATFAEAAVSGRDAPCR